MTTQLSTPEIRLVDGHPVTTSRAVALFFGRHHKHVTEKIKNLDCSDQFLTANFSAVQYKHRGNTYTEYQITRDGFAFLAMGFTGKKAAQFKEAYINAFNQMEKQLHTPPALLEPPIPPQRFLTIIDQGQIHQYPLNTDQALIDLPKLAVKVKQMEVLHQALGQQIEDLKESYDLGWFLS